MKFELRGIAALCLPGLVSALKISFLNFELNYLNFMHEIHFRPAHDIS
jgi:hypothetical protein